MTIKEYISQKLQPFGTLSEAQLLDMSHSGGFDSGDEYTEENSQSVAESMIRFIEEMAFSPKMASINESGFSMSWDYSGLGKYYLWLCRKYGVTPNDSVLEILGLNVITDKSEEW